MTEHERTTLSLYAILCWLLIGYAFWLCHELQEAKAELTTCQARR